MNKIIKNTLILTIITVVSGLLLLLKIMKNLTRRMQRRLSETTGILTTSQKLQQGNRTAAKPWDMC